MLSILNIVKHRLHVCLSLPRVELADVVVLPVLALVGVLRLGDHAEQRGVGVGQRLDGPAAAARAAALQGVRGTAESIALYVVCSFTITEKAPAPLLGRFKESIKTLC